MVDETNGQVGQPNGDGDSASLDMDSSREPQLVSGRSGTRMFSLAALLERIVVAFIDEHGTDSEALRAAKTRAQRMSLVLATTDYVLTVESVRLNDDDKAELLRRAYSELFGFGPLDALFADETITTISLEGGDNVSVRYGHADFTTLGPLFEDAEHMRRIVARLLLAADAELNEDQPIIETGLNVGGRPVAVNLVAPPISYVLNVDLRLHPKTALRLTDLVAVDFMTAAAAQMLTTLAQSPYGLIVVGDVECGKTTLLNALALALPVADGLVSVERAGEMRLPDGARQFRVRWPVGTEAGATFGDLIETALGQSPEVLLLDEVRADAPLTIAPLLANENPPRQLWAFRGVPDAKRLQSALGMLARRANVMMGEQLVYALYDRLPFVVTVARIQGRLQLFSVAEWQPHPESDYPDYIMLFQYRDGRSRPTGERPVRDLDLPQSFWE